MATLVIDSWYSLTHISIDPAIYVTQNICDADDEKNNNDAMVTLPSVAVATSLIPPTS